jgi:hypothetical protein
VISARPFPLSDLTFSEKRKLEKLLGMSTGYVLNYSNRTFANFVMESTGHDIYDPRYATEGTSKANRLRAFWKKEDNHVVGKLMHDMLNDIDAPDPDIEICRLIVFRLLGRIAQSPVSDRVIQHVNLPPDRTSQKLVQLKEEFVRMAAETDRNKVGLSFERFLNRLFELFQLQPRQPFRIVGEQIDGSFALDGQIYLLESKWEKGALPEADLLVFRGKIEGKSTFTRGVFIALNGISSQARDAITRGKAPSFFVMDGHDLMMILSEAISLPEFLRRRVRLLAEEGRVCVPFSELT